MREAMSQDLQAPNLLNHCSGKRGPKHKPMQDAKCPELHIAVRLWQGHWSRVLMCLISNQEETRQQKKEESLGLTTYIKPWRLQVWSIWSVSAAECWSLWKPFLVASEIQLRNIQTWDVSIWSGGHQTIAAEFNETTRRFWLDWG